MVGWDWRQDSGKVLQGKSATRLEWWAGTWRQNSGALEKCYKVKVPQDQSVGLAHGEKTLEKSYKVKVPHDKTLQRCSKMTMEKLHKVKSFLRELDQNGVMETRLGKSATI